MISKEEAFKKISELVERFGDQIDSYKRADYNETQTRRDFIDPFFKALGWDVDNEQGYAESYREVIHEDRVKVERATKAPDYSFRLGGGKRLFFVEAKKPSVDVREDISPAYQVRRYGWSAKLAISIITDFEEFSVYDCTKKPNANDKASVARIKYLTFTDYIKGFDFLWDTFSKERVLKGSFDRFVEGKSNKKGTATVDREFLLSLDTWRKYLATSISWNNKQLDEEEINFAVQQVIDRIIFLRIAEDRGVEPENNLRHCIKSGNYYQNLFELFKTADDKYNSGLFDFNKDNISKDLTVDNKVIRNIIEELYYPKCEYAFSVMPVEILGTAYEQFLGKVIRITPAHHAKIEEKPEVRKAGGVYYTPQYIVDYIVKNTVGKLTEGKTPEDVSEIKIVDPACGSGSFLIGAYQYLLDWHKDYYTKKGKPTQNKKENTYRQKGNPLTPDGNLTTAEKKRILLNNIYGVDLDVNAVEVTKLSLLLKCMEGETPASISYQMSMFRERVLPSLDNNIKSGNSLIDTDYYDGQLDFGDVKKIKPFNWEKEFPDIFNRNVEVDKRIYFKQQYYKVIELEKDTGRLISEFMAEEPKALYEKRNPGFDVVIGNPPYVRVSDKNMLNYFIARYHHQDYQKDLYLLFLEKFKQLLVTGGMVGVIVPNTWLQSINYRNIRKYIVSEYFWHRVLHIKEPVFKAVVDTHIVIFEKNNFIKNNDVKIDILQNNKIIEHQTINQYDLPANGEVINILANKNEKALFEKIKQNSILIKEICNVYNGVKPFEKGKGTPPQTARTMKEKPFVVENQPKPEGENWMPLIRGRLMNRYVNYWNNNSWINYGKWLAAPRDPKIFKAEEKIIVRQTGDSIIATMIYKGMIARDNLHLILSEKEELKFILGILNSKLTDFYYNQINPEKGEALAQVKKSHVEHLPIPFVSEENKLVKTKIIDCVNQLLALNDEKLELKLPSKIDQINRRIEFLTDRIDQLVYQLYGLTEEEINIIEGK